VIQLSAKNFARLVAEAFEKIPEDVRARLENVALVAEEEVSDFQRKELGLEPGEQLLGLFEGVARGEEVNAATYLPPKISIFSKPILEDAGSLEEVRSEISDTLWHEVAHYLGLDEDEVQHAEHVHDELHRKQGT
jgi:predicted Zn-dependent protease with MMP-like domain